MYSESFWLKNDPWNNVQAYPIQKYPAGKCPLKSLIFTVSHGSNTCTLNFKMHVIFSHVHGFISEQFFATYFQRRQQTFSMILLYSIQFLPLDIFSAAHFYHWIFFMCGYFQIVARLSFLFIKSAMVSLSIKVIYRVIKV